MRVLLRISRFPDFPAKKISWNLKFRRILPTLDVQEIQDLTLAAPKSNKVFEVLQAEVL